MKEQKFIPLRCPQCLAQVNVPTSEQTAKCFLCGNQWPWRKFGVRVTFATGEAITC